MEEQNNAEWQPPPLPPGLTPRAANRKKLYFYSAIVAFVFGITMLILGLLKIASGLTGGGGVLAFFAVVLFGLSFIPQPEISSNELPMSAFESITKIFYAPATVFRHLRAHPGWFVPLLIMTILTSLYLTAFTERLGAQRIASYVTEKLAQSPFPIPPEALEQSRRQQLEQLTNPVARVGNVISSFGGTFVSFAVLAGIYLAIILAMGGRINFWQSLAVVAYSFFPVAVVQRVLSLIILYLKDPTDVHPILGQQSLVTDNLGALVAPASNPILFVVLSAFGLLSFYGLWLVATGLKNAGERVSSGAAWTAALIVWLLGLVLGILSAAFFPSFLS